MSLEDRHQTEEMRHIPPLSFILSRVQHEYGRRLQVLGESLDRAETSDQKSLAMVEFDAACRWMLRTAEYAVHRKLTLQPGHSAVETARRTVALATEELQKVDADLFRRRIPFQNFERSEAESVYAAFTAVPFYILRCSEILGPIDPDIHERLLACEFEPAVAAPLVQTPIA